MEINFDTKGSSLFMEKGGGMRGRVEGGDPGEEKAVIEAGLWGPHPDLLCILAGWGPSTSTILYSVIQMRWTEGYDCLSTCYYL